MPMRTLGNGIMIAISTKTAYQIVRATYERFVYGGIVCLIVLCHSFMVYVRVAFWGGRRVG